MKHTNASHPHAFLSAIASSAQRPKVQLSGEEGPSGGTETVDLSLRILEHLVGSEEAVGVSELARIFDSSKSTVYRHLRSLARHGFVRQESVTMRYEVGVKLFILGERTRRRFDVFAVAHEEMARLRDQCGQAVTLSTLVEGQVVVLELLQGRTIVNFGTQPGTVLDLHATAHGKVALAFGPTDILERCLGRKLHPWTPQTICTRSALERAVAQVRARGWATAPNQAIQGVNGLAAPIFNHLSNYVGAVAMAGSIQHVLATPTREQVHAVLEAAEGISRRLGWRGK